MKTNLTPAASVVAPQLAGKAGLSPKVKIMAAMGLTFFFNLMATAIVFAQDIGAGTAALGAADTAVRGFFGPATNIMFAVAAITGLIGAVKVYQKISSGDPDTGRVAASWFGACIFLIVAAVAISAFFGVA